MQTTRRELLDDFLDTVGAKSDANARNRAERALNRALDRIWSRHPWQQFQLTEPYTFATVAGVRTYALPDYFGRVNAKDDVIRNVTGRAKIWPIESTALVTQDPLQGTTNEQGGTPTRYYLGGVVGVHTQPSPAGEDIEALSDEAADTVARVLVEGINDKNDWTRAQFTLNGTNPVALGKWKRVQSFAKSYPEGVTPTTELTSSAGQVILRIVAAPLTELQKLLADEAQLELQELVLYPIPNVVHTIAVPIFRRPRRLRFDADPIPTDWDNALLEDLTVQWRSSGDGTLDEGIARPALIDLIALDNMRRPRTSNRPWMGA
jgi:hypothetical protein